LKAKPRGDTPKGITARLSFCSDAEGRARFRYAKKNPAYTADWAAKPDFLFIYLNYIFFLLGF
jgi:hypothetical protein